MSATIYISGGGKGGVGKTMVSLALVDWLVNGEFKNKVTIVETDDSNAEVFKAYEHDVSVKKQLINMDHNSGWIALMNLMPEWAENNEQVVINTAARATEAMEQNLNDLLIGAKELGITVKMIWTINRQRDSLNLINGLLKKCPVQTTIIKNLHCGSADKFVLFDKSEFAKKVESINLPDLNDEVADKIYSDRLTLSQVDKFKFGERMALQRFKTDAAEQFNKIK